MSANFSLSFLGDLEPNPSDERVEQAWRDRVFPLTLTRDFGENWKAVRDPAGRFITSSGVRCRVEPRPHHVRRCAVVVVRDRQKHEDVVPYEAVVLAPIIRRLWLSGGAEWPGRPFQAERRHFVDNLASKLPARWREVIVQCDLQHLVECDDAVLGSVRHRIYEPLADVGNIRVVTLLPSTASHAPVECTLAEARPGVAAGLEYEALSYVWGSATTRRDITLNGLSFPVTVNLEAALRQLRSKNGAPRVLWIDALCIDQTNVGERNEQVRRMDSIYRGASAVVVWLGPATNTSSGLFRSLRADREMMRGFESSLKMKEFLYFPFVPEPHCSECDGIPRRIGPGLGWPEAIRHRNNSHVRDVERVPLFLHEHSYADKVESFAELLARPWWRRVWILQEVILAKSVTLVCGPDSLDWQLFQGLLYTAIRQAKRFGTYSAGPASRRGRLAGAQLRLLKLANDTLALFLLQTTSPFADNARNMSMSSLVSLTSTFEATDARDKIFALVSLLPQESVERQRFQPEYALDSRRLYIQVARSFLDSSGRLDIITARPRLPGPWPPNAQSMLPSWVPDWNSAEIWPFNTIWINGFSQARSLASLTGRGKDDGAADLDRKGQVYNASLHMRSPFPLAFSARDEVLHARGVSVDVIFKVGEVWVPGAAACSAEDVDPGPPSRSQKEAHLDTVESWASLAGEQTDAIYPYTGQTLREAFWRTVLLDRAVYTRVAVNDLDIRRLPSRLDGCDPQESELSDPLRDCFPPRSRDEAGRLLTYVRQQLMEAVGFASVNLHCMWLRFVVTKNGYIGLSHPGARPGDKIAILLGAPVPLVLREFSEGYVFIGQSYVHGVMDGEVVQALRDSGRGHRLEDFELFNLI